MQNTAAYVIDKCGGYHTVAGWLKLPYSTVYGWVYDSLHVPAQHQFRLLSAARSHGVRLCPKDFFPTPLPAVAKKVRRRAS